MVFATYCSRYNGWHSNDLTDNQIEELTDLTHGWCDEDGYYEDGDNEFIPMHKQRIVNLIKQMKGSNTDVTLFVDNVSS